MFSLKIFSCKIPPPISIKLIISTINLRGNYLLETKTLGSRKRTDQVLSHKKDFSSWLRWTFLSLFTATLFPRGQATSSVNKLLICLCINSTNANLYFSSFAQHSKYTFESWKASQHGVFTTVPLAISLFHSVSLPFSHNNFFIKLLLFISFLCSWPKPFFAPIQRVLFHY